MQIHFCNEQTEASATVTINELPIQNIDSRYRDMFIHRFPQVATDGERSGEEPSVDTHGDITI